MKSDALFWAPDPAVIVGVFGDGGGGGGNVCVRVCESTSVYLPATTTGLILTNCSRHVSADTPPPAYMPPDEQMGQESQSMDTSSNLVAPNMARGGESCTLPASPSQGGPQYIKTKPGSQVLCDFSESGRIY